MSGEGGAPSPTRLAAGLGVGLIAIVFVLNLMAPGEVPVSLERLEALTAEGAVLRLEVGDGDIVGYLTHEVAVDDAGQRRLASAVVVDRLSPGAEDAVARWRAAGLAVSRSEVAEASRSRREWGWLAAVGGLLSFGVYYLVLQARLHRRVGSPRQRLEEARAQLESGAIDGDEYERRVAEISVEL